MIRSRRTVAAGAHDKRRGRRAPAALAAGREHGACTVRPLIGCNFLLHCCDRRCCRLQGSFGFRKSHLARTWKGFSMSGALRARGLQLVSQLSTAEAASGSLRGAALVPCR